MTLSVQAEPLSGAYRRVITPAGTFVELRCPNGAFKRIAFVHHPLLPKRTTH